MNLAEFRANYPQYNDMPDYDLADALYKKFYSDIPRYNFFNSIGVQDATSDVPVYGTDTMPRPSEPEPTPIGKQLAGGLETGAAMLSGATTGAVGYLDRGVSQLVKELMSGEFGSDEAADRIEAAAMRGAQSMTYAPRTQAGQQYMRGMEEALGWIPPIVGPGINPFPAGSVSASRAMVPKRQPALPAGLPQSVGAAAMSQADQRVATGAGLPVPFARGNTPGQDSRLTAGQATRDFAQLQFERETAKLGEAGRPLRERMLNQNETVLRNFDYGIESLDPQRVDPRDIGAGVDNVIRAQQRQRRQRVQNAYGIAERAGEMESPVNTQPMAPVFDQLFDMEDVASNIGVAKKSALRLGIATRDEDGNLVFRNDVPLKTLEAWRQVINDATDLADRREARARRMFFRAIDQITQTAGGDLYRRARKEAAGYFSEFENAALMNRLLATKRGTTERRVAFEDVADNILFNSPVEEIRRFRGTIQKGSPDGRQVWRDIKAYGIDWLKRKAYGAQTDERGNPVVKPAAFRQAVERLDREGKLDALYGKRGAQLIRDLEEISHDISTVPPGSVNYSGTSSALLNALSGIVDLGITANVGLPAPVATGLRMLARNVSDKKLKRRIQLALEGKTVTRRGTR